MPSSWLGALAGGLGGLQQISQQLIADRYRTQERQREAMEKDRNYQLAVQQQEQQRLQAAFQNEMATKQFAQQQGQIERQNAASVYNSPFQRGVDFTPEQMAENRKFNFPTQQHFTPGAKTLESVFPGLPPTPGQKLDEMGYRRPESLEEQSTTATMGLQRQAGEQAAGRYSHETDDWTRQAALRKEYESKPPGWQPNSSDVMKLIMNGVPNASMKSFMTPDQEIQYDAKRAAAVAQATAGVERPMTENQLQAWKNSTRRQVQALATPMYKLEEGFMNMENAMEGINKAASTKGIGPQAQTILVGFQKQLDALSVVREAEYLRSEQIRPLEDRIKGIIEKIHTGSGLSPQEFQEYVNMSKMLRDNARRVLEQRIEPFRADADVLNQKYKGAVPWEQIFNPPWEGSQQPFDLIFMDPNQRQAPMPGAGQGQQFKQGIGRGGSNY